MAQKIDAIEIHHYRLPLYPPFQASWDPKPRTRFTNTVVRVRAGDRQSDCPGGILYFQGSEQYLPEFVQRIEAIYPPEGGKLHVSGVSNGGISAFRIATMIPEKVASITAVPGFPKTSDFDQLDKLTHIPIALYAGENDTS